MKAYFSWEPPGKIRLLGFSLVLWDIPELPIQQTKFPGRGSQISYRYGWARGSAPQTSFTGSMAWRAILRLRAGSRPQDYEMTIDRDIKHSGTASARIRFIGQNLEGFGTLMQTI